MVVSLLPRNCDLGCDVDDIGNVVSDVENVFIGVVYRGYGSDRKNLFGKDFLGNCGGF